ncbi:LSU ribosomal protein L4p (L1e) [Patulibacter medicamentivorans]|jgi:large subunit ribosomal protein L4|uniref:Large ribosomal subunit protein uL4 n=1 Tax=Patulibacter medicamentivorans TaxID=1097667 RepID=H0E8P1_9ACTN|nr:50S ribosomal protein L4 [Patulibacter medicamentivorans]EHN09919.1 LSU ribosomal protein L4p (L1e) [Patulibacter medicamentivorans]
MPEAPILGGGTVQLDDAVFGVEFNGPLVHQNVRHELNARRQGTAKTKTRGQVSGGGSKPWRQKGTGRARAGSSRSPIWTGGGTIFGPSPRHYTFKINRKEKRAALRSALSLHGLRGSVAAFDIGTFAEPSTKAAGSLLKGWDGKGSILVVLAESEAKVALSFRNLTKVSVLPAEAVGVADVVGAGRLLLSQVAIDELTNRAAGKAAVAEEVS